MDGQVMIMNIRKYLKKKYSYQIINGLKTGKSFVAERRIIITEVLTGINEEILELLLEQMYEEGMIVKDDGHTVSFSTDFVFG